MLALSPSRKPAHRPAGFTLIELLVTMALAAVFAVLAVPSLQTMMAGQRVSAAASDLHAAAMQARGVAMRDNRRVVVQPVDGSASTPGNWSSGWRIYVDLDVNSSFSSSTDTLVVTQEAVSSDLQITKVTGTNNFFAYEGTGFMASIGGSTNATWRVSSSRTSRVRCIVIERSGRARVHDPYPSSTCPTT